MVVNLNFVMNYPTTSLGDVWFSLNNTFWDLAAICLPTDRTVSPND